MSSTNKGQPASIDNWQDPLLHGANKEQTTSFWDCLGSILSFSGVLCFSANHCAFLGFYGLPRGIPSNGQMSNCPTFPEPKCITWPFSGSGVLRVLRARRSSGRQSLLHLWRIQLGARIVFRTLRNSEGLVANPNEKPQIFPREDLFVLLLLCDRVQPPRGDIMDRICATKHDMGMDGLDVKI